MGETEFSSSIPIAQLLDELDADSAYATGERPFPLPVSQEDAAGIAELLHHQVDIGVEVRARVAAQAGHDIACKPGCNACCSELIMVSLPEAVAVARWLADHPEEREAFLGAYGQWRQRMGQAPERLLAAIARGDEDGYMRLYVAQFLKGVPCAFNRDGLCSIYPVRPVVCRVAHALDTAEHCRGDSPDGNRPARFSFVPLDALVARTRGVFLAAHHAMGGPTDVPAVLCDAVYEMLIRAPETLPGARHGDDAAPSQRMMGSPHSGEGG